MGNLATLRRTLQRIALAVALAAIACGASAATPWIAAAIDTDDNASTGCTIATADGPLAGIDLLVTTHLLTTAANVRVARLERQVCSGGALVAPSTQDASGWPVGLGAGDGGRAVVETYVPRAWIARFGTVKIVVLSGDGAGGGDATGAFRVLLAAPQAAPDAPLPVPFSPWLALPLALAIGWSAYRYGRRRPEHARIAMLVVVLACSGLALAATVVRDGAIGDWRGIAAAIVDPAGDAPPDADIVAVYAQVDDANLYLRVDADVRKAAASNNTAPMVSAGAATTITLPAPAALAGSASDDGLPIPPGALTTTWSVEPGAPGPVTFGDPAHPATSATFNAPGVYTLRLTASDGELSTSATTTVTVVDGAPMLAAVANRTIALGTRFQVVLEAKEGNAGDLLTFSLPTAPPGASLNPAPLVDWVPSAGQLGTHAFTARVVDSGGKSATTSFNVTVVHTNHPPVLGPQASLSMPVGAAFARTLTASDPDDGDVLTFALVSGPNGMTLTGADLAWSTSGHNPGDYAVTVKVTDDGGLSDQKSFTITLKTAAPPPVAKDDSYTVKINGTLTVPAPGVLSNDAYAGGGALAATKLTDPGVGSLSTFDADGSFTYQAPATVPGVPLTMAREWNTSSGGSDRFHELVADLNGDGYPDVVSFDNNGGIRARSGLNGVQLWSADRTGAEDCALNAGNGSMDSRVLADLDDSGHPALAFTTFCAREGSSWYDNIVAFDPTGHVKWVSPPLSKPHPDIVRGATPPPPGGFTPGGLANGSGLSVARLSADGPPVLLLRQEIPRDWGYALYYDANNNFHYAGCRAVTGLPADENVACRATLIISGVDGSVLQALVVRNPAAVQNFGGPGALQQMPPIAMDIDGDGRVDLVSGTEVWMQNAAGGFDLAWQLTQSVNDTAVADLDGDGKAEIIHVRNSASPEDLRGIFVYSFDGQLKRRIPLQTYWFTPMTIADVDGDGRSDIVLGADGTLYAFRDDGRTIWAYQVPQEQPDNPVFAPFFVQQPQSFSISNAAPQVYDLDGDGVVEVIIAAYSRIMVLDGRTGRRKLNPFWTYNWSYNDISALILADVNNDGHVDIVQNAAFVFNCGFVGADFATECFNLVGPIALSGGGANNWLPGPKAFPHVQYRSTAIDNNSRVLHDTTVSRIFRVPAQQGTIGDPRLAQATSFTYDASDGPLSSAPAKVFIDIVPDNRPPVFTSVPPTSLLQSSIPNVYDLSASDPDPGDTIAFSLKQAPNWVTMSGPARISFAPNVSWGQTSVIVTATDSRGASTDQIFIVNLTTTAVTVPDVLGMALGQAQAALIAQDLQGVKWAEQFDLKPAGTVLAQQAVAGAVVGRFDDIQLTVSTGPQPVPMPFVVGQQLSAANAILTAVGLSVDVTPVFSTTIPAGEITAQSPAANTLLQPATAPPVDLTVSAGGPLPAPIASILLQPGPGPLARLANTDVQFKAVAILTDGTSADVSLTAAWSTTNAAAATVNTAGFVKAKSGGTATIAATLSGKSGSVIVNVSSLVPGDNTAPVAAITSPADDATATGPVTVTGTATDPNFLRYELAYAPAGEANFTVLSEGTSAVTNGTLGTFDPTTLLNDLYTLRLRVFDRGENVSEASVTVQARGQRKVGLFSLTFIDLQIPMSGLPITVSRTYDSRDKGTGDFGVGWRLSLQTLRVRANRVLGTGWLRTVSGPTVSLAATSEHKVSVTLPDGRVETFDMVVSPTSNIGSLDATSVVGFVPRPDARGTLEVLGNRDLLILDDGAQTILVDDSTLEDYDPKRFRYTAFEGTIYEIHRVDGVTKVVDTNGNMLTFGPGGITHSAGKGVTFVRDAKGRIAEIVDPIGNTTTYAFDANGDLASRTDATGRVSTYLYDRAHNLIEARDPAGNRALRNDYDAEGRLLSTTDANGGTVTYTHDLGASREVIRDRLGFQTVYDYDAEGNVVARTDALGRLWTTTFDARGNPLVRTDPLGRTLVRTYDARDNLLSETNEDGNTRSWTYDAQGRVLVETDPEGRATHYTYDANGNLIRVDAFEGGITLHAYDGAGRRTSTTDPLGRITLFGYDASGNLVSITDPAGAVTGATYDAANRPISNVDALGGTTTRVYDAAGRVVRIVDPLGHATTIAYATLGDGTKPASRTDPLGRTTTYEYDVLARRVKTSHPDGTTELKAYDAEGRETETTDRAGATTRFTRDALGRTVLTTFADGATVTSAFDEVGRLKTVVDESGHTTTRTYATNRETVTEPLGGVTIRDFDGARRIVKVADALGRILRQTYDSGGHPLLTTYADGSTSSVAYDAARQAIASTDPLGRTTHRTYDAAGRLATLTDPAGGVTTYGYDANGRMTSRRDGNGRVTTYAFDAAGRQLSLKRPGGSQEFRVYDAMGNVVGRTDFAGRSTTFTYDAMDRLVGKIVPGGATTSYAYDAAGRRMQAGGDRYAYDLRGRLVRETKSGGEVLDYVRDPSGRVTSLSAPHGSATYSYDARGRMASVTGGAGTTTYAYDVIGNVTGVTHPNGVVETNGYDARNRRVSIAHAGPGGSIAGFAYTLDAAGRRVRVDETGPATDARTVRYGYDDADRLTSELIDTPGLPSFAITYAYDAAGNRLKMVRGGVATDYAYDADDRLLSQTTGGASVVYGWDANGNLASRTAGASVRTYFHDGEDRLTSVSGPSGSVGYVYDADGMRIRRSSGGVTTDYLLDKALPASMCPCGPAPPGAMAQVIAETTGVGTVSYTYGHMMLDRSESGVGAGTFLRDAQHSVRGLTIPSGAVSDRYTYDAFGVELSSTGATADVHRFAGEPVDPVAGLQYHRARHYDPSIGRFTSTDPEAGDPEMPATFHRYLYARDDPVDRVDPTGRSEWTLPSLTIGQAISTSLNVGFAVTLGARATGYARDWSEAANMGVIATIGTLSLLVPYSLAFGGELAAAKAAASLAARSDAFRVGLHLLRIAAVEGTESIAGKEALFEVEKHMGIFIQQAFRNPAVRCTVIAGMGGIVVGTLGLLGGNIPGAPNFMAAAKVINYGPLAEAMELVIPGLRHSFGCP